MARLMQASRLAILVWAGLMLATLASWWLGIHESDTPGDGASAGTAAVLVVTFVKIRFVAMHFMEVRAAPLLLRVILDAYVIVVCTTLVILYIATS